MEKDLQARMAFHGAVAIILGLLAGFPYALVVTGALAGTERAWRMAHMEGVTNGLVVLAVAALLPRLALGEGARRLLAASLVVTAYANTAAATLGAATGERGLAFGGTVANSVVFLSFTVAIVTVFLGLGLVVQGARRARAGGTD
jgi:hypothetical protein